MALLNKHGEHDSDMDYIVELQANVNFYKKMAGESNAALAVYRTFLENNNHDKALGSIDAMLQKLFTQPTITIDTLKAKAELFDDLVHGTEMARHFCEQHLAIGPNSSAAHALLKLNSILAKAKELK